ncbi:LEAF RUST 10 DISEASE-RESISTANCE LOCUS RECEPTOR-LIKE PROTEIN KINASE-like 2.1 [Curcuma longa]|uniref:LEAF RUST 10 DISEASE-RESISTANCE LOCUS RECEPTOR-LIKE PROTEIN KINASE-like 2.1 n=1 Tax=Curcuma longa TaxID=136217 RepID=UPI003D9F51A3
MTFKAPWRSFYALLLPLLFLLLLSQAAVTTSGQQLQQQGQETCPPFSCGLLHNISFPFRRTTDPHECGDRRYELTCDGNKSTISIGSTHYLITQLSHENYTIRLVDPNFANGSCGLPSQSLSPSNISNSGFDHYPYGWWASFMSCTRRIEGQSWYQLVPCLSNNTTFVYVVVADEGFSFSYLYPSCHFVSMIPAAEVRSFPRDAFHILQNGFDLLFNVTIFDWQSVIHSEACPPFSCGLFNNIGHPFRRTTDPRQCGDRRFELTCDGNKPTMSIGSTHYLITQISYEYNSISLVDPKLASGSCGLPSQSLSPSYFSSSGYHDPEDRWASFMNCTRRIEGQSSYQLVPCLSNNNTFVYVVVAYEGYSLSYLYPSCHFVSMIPAIEAESSFSTRDAFHILQEGFHLPLSTDRGPTLFSQCLSVFKRQFLERLRSKSPILLRVFSLVRSEIDFASCIGERNKNTLTTRLTIAVVVLIQIVQLFVVFLILGRLLIAPMIVWFLLGYKLWNRRVSVDLVEKFLQRQQTLMPTRYAYSELIAITRHFREKLGQGGFGSVFKGELIGGHLVAVKMLSNSKCNGDDFINEVSTIGRIHHVNVVRLVGYCSEGSKRALVYEYMPNGSLDKYIFAPDGTNGHSFTSEKLIQIAIGIARGIDYLHQGCDMQILHFDIKPPNILIDKNFTPKISDFGLAKLYPKTNALVSISAAGGTIGYTAPELVSRSFGKISFKADVYSFGMLLMEMAGRRRNVDPLAGNSSRVYYPSWVYDKLTRPAQEVEIEEEFEIQNLEKKLAIVGLWCIQMRPFDRPTMTRVIEMLEVEDVDCLPIPPKPFFSSGGDSVAITKPSLGLISSSELSVVSE